MFKKLFIASTVIWIVGFLVRAILNNVIPGYYNHPYGIIDMLTIGLPFAISFVSFMMGTFTSFKKRLLK